MSDGPAEERSPAPHPLDRLLSSPVVLGGLYLLLAAASEAKNPDSKEIEAVLGSGGDRVARVVSGQYGGVLRGTELKLALFAAILGGVLGAFAGLLVDLAANGRATRWLRALSSLAIVVCLHGAALAWAIAMYPALYFEMLYVRGGMRRGIQIALTDRLGPYLGAAIPLAIVTMILAFVVVRSRGAEPARPRARAWALGAGFAVLGGSLVISRPAPQRKASLDHPNVLILAADSLREDAVTPELMPHVTALAARGVRFLAHTSSIARTLPSWTTLLTGQYPHHHGIRSTFPRLEQAERPIDTLPRRLSAAGYQTLFVSDYAGDCFPSANLGFEDTDAPRLDVPGYIHEAILARAFVLLPFIQTFYGRKLFPDAREMREATPADLLADEAISKLRALPNRGAPFFAIVFFGTTHDPYATPYPYTRRFGDPSYVGTHKYLRPTMGDIMAADAANMQALYRGAAVSIDDAMQRILDELAREGVADDTIVVVTSDHGEDLLDNKAVTHGHGDSLFGDEQLLVPLVVFDPREKVAPHVVTSRTRHLDLAPTLYDLTGVAGPPGLDGVSLRPALEGKAMDSPAVFAETGAWLTIGWVDPKLRIPYPKILETVQIDRGDSLVFSKEMDIRTTFGKHRMVWDGDEKLIYAPTPTGPRYMLYDTRADPENTTDIAADHPDDVARLKKELWDWMLEDTAMEERNGFLAPKGVTEPEVDGAHSPPSR